MSYINITHEKMLTEGTYCKGATGDSYCDDFRHGDPAAVVSSKEYCEEDATQGDGIRRDPSGEPCVYRAEILMPKLVDLADSRAVTDLKKPNIPSWQKAMHYAGGRDCWIGLHDRNHPDYTSPTLCVFEIRWNTMSLT